MDEDAIDRATDALDMLEITLMIHESGRTDIIEASAAYELTRDDEYCFALEGLAVVGDYMREDTNENSDECSMYFSSKNMMKYYRLCRSYGKAKGYSLQDNPYMKKAERFVLAQMSEPDCYYVYTNLYTKIDRKWASGLSFHYDPNYFYEYLMLLSRLINVFDFYTNTLVELRAEIKTLKASLAGKVVTFPKEKTNSKRRAA